MKIGMFNDPYMLRKETFKYYVIPSCEYLKVLPFPNKYISCWFRSNAEIILAAMNAAFREGYRFNDFEKGN